MLVTETWRDRLIAAIDASEWPDRQIGIRSGAGQSWVSDFKNGGKVPKLDTFLDVCRFLDVSPAYILTGLPITPEIESILQGLLRLGPESRAHLLAYIVSLREGDDIPPQP